MCICILESDKKRFFLNYRSQSKKFEIDCYQAEILVVGLVDSGLCVINKEDVNDKKKISVL